LSGCVRNITAFCQLLLRPIISAILADTDISVKPKYRPISARPIYRSISKYNSFLRSFKKFYADYKKASAYQMELSIKKSWIKIQPKGNIPPIKMQGKGFV